MTNTLPAGSQDGSQDDGRATSTQSSGPVEDQGLDSGEGAAHAASTPNAHANKNAPAELQTAVAAEEPKISEPEVHAPPSQARCQADKMHSFDAFGSVSLFETCCAIAVYSL
jgi:hypothetical protein